MNWRKQLYKFIQLPVLLGGVLFSGNSSTVNLSAAEADDMITVSSRQALKSCGAPRCKTLGYIYPGQEAKSIKRYRYWVKIKYRIKIRYRGGKTRYKWRTFWVRKPSVVSAPTRSNRQVQSSCTHCETRQRRGSDNLGRTHATARDIVSATQSLGIRDTSSSRMSARIPSTSLTPEQQERYRKEIWKAANKCRMVGRRRVCGNHSKRWCYRAVKEAGRAVGALSPNFGGGRYAVYAHSRGYLKREGYTNYISQGGTEYNAPEFCKLVYSGGKDGAGHIETVMYNTENGKRMYCSDFCKNQPISTRLRRRLVGVYCK